MTHVLLTVGTNPLPVLVAARRLRAFYCERDPEPPALVLLYSPQSRRVAESIQSLLGTRGVELRKISDAMLPRRISQEVREVSQKLGIKRCHVHYTGGTKAMGAHTVEAIVSSGGPCESSYLDLRRHQIVGTELAYGPDDERRDWNVSLRELVQLHGFTTDFCIRHGGITKRYGNVEVAADEHYLNAGALPGEELLELASEIVTVAGSSQAALVAFRAWTNNRAVEWPELLTGRHLSARWRAVGGRVQALDASVSYELFEKNTYLEWAAAYHLREALKTRGFPCRVYWDVHIASAPEPPKYFVNKDFQLDVICILGYQAVLISCTTAGDVKEKGFEAFHRIRQAGGERTFAVVLCASDGTAASVAEEDLRHHTGIPGEDSDSSVNQLRVWGRECWPSLRAKFDELLDELNWR